MCDSRTSVIAHRIDHKEETKMSKMRVSNKDRVEDDVTEKIPEKFEEVFKEREKKPVKTAKKFRRDKAIG